MGNGLQTTIQNGFNEHIVQPLSNISIQTTIALKNNNTLLIYPSLPNRHRMMCVLFSVEWYEFNCFTITKSNIDNKYIFRNIFINTTDLANSLKTDDKAGKYVIEEKSINYSDIMKMVDMYSRNEHPYNFYNIDYDKFTGKLRELYSNIPSEKVLTNEKYEYELFLSSIAGKKSEFAQYIGIEKDMVNKLNSTKFDDLF